MKYNRLLRTATIMILSIVLFYLPSILFQMEKDDDVWEWDFIGMIMATFYTAAFCVNYLWLVPSLLRRNINLPFFFLMNVCMVLATMIFIPFWLEFHDDIPHPHGKIRENESLIRCIISYAGFSIRDGIMVVLAAALAFAIRFGREKDSIHTRELELNAERRQIELQSLKAQLNPHFLFNSLNNIYALIEFAPEKAQYALHTLSRMLRFMIYDASGLVSLEKEAKFIGEYVEMMRLRIGSACDLQYLLSDDLPQNVKIAPLLYVTLVENAFKHSASNGSDYYIHISLYSEILNRDEGKTDEKLVFRVVNTYPENKNGSEDGRDEGENIGIGLVNVKRQLNLLYPGSNRFEITESAGVYSATIILDVGALNN